MQRHGPEQLRTSFTTPDTGRRPISERTARGFSLAQLDSANDVITAEFGRRTLDLSGRLLELQVIYGSLEGKDIRVRPAEFGPLTAQMLENAGVGAEQEVQYRLGFSEGGFCPTTLSWDTEQPEMMGKLIVEPLFREVKMLDVVPLDQNNNLLWDRVERVAWFDPETSYTGEDRSQKFKAQLFCQNVFAQPRHVQLGILEELLVFAKAQKASQSAKK